MLKELLQPSIKELRHLIDSADPLFETLLRQTAFILIYSRIDELPEDLLDTLAHQFHVEGWELAETEKEKRSLIKRAIELHRYKGTPWAVKEAIKSVGYKNVELIERLPEVRYDGQYNYSGLEDYAGGVRWALFRVIVDIGESKKITQIEIQKLADLINEYKNIRSHLKDISFAATVEDAFSDLIDALQALLQTTVEETYNWGLRYDGTISYNQAERFLHNGIYKYNNQKVYTEWTVAGKKYDNEWDILDDISLKQAYIDEVSIDGKYNGFLTYSGGYTYGSDYPFCVDTAITMRLIKHIKHNGKYNYGGIYYDGTFWHNANKSYFGGIYYKGNIVSEEAFV